MAFDSLGNFLKGTRSLSRHVQRTLRELSDNIAREAKRHPFPLRPIPVPIPVTKNGSLGSRLTTRNFGTFPGFFAGRAAFTRSSYGRYPSPCWLARLYGSSCAVQATSRASRLSLFVAFLKAGRQQCPITRTVIKVYNGTLKLELGTSSVGSNCRAALYNAHQKLAYSPHNIAGNRSNTHSVFNGAGYNVQVRSSRAPGTSFPDIRISLNILSEQTAVSSAHAGVSCFASEELALADSAVDSVAVDESDLESHEQVFTGCYLDFPVDFSFNMPAETQLTEDVLDGMLKSVQEFEQKLKALKDDLIAVFDLGELPITYIRDEQVVRVRFDNCDVDRLEDLCRDKNISSGRIFSTDGAVRGKDVYYNDDMFQSMTPPDTLRNTNSGVALMECQLMESDNSCLSSVSELSEFSDIEPLSDHTIRRPALLPREPPLDVLIHDEYAWA